MSGWVRNPLARRRAGVALAAAALLAVSACGSSGTTQSSTSSTSTGAPVTHTAPATTTTVTSPSQAHASSGPRTCSTSQLALSFAGGQGAAGTAYLHYRLTNRGSTCVMVGYPGVAVLDASGRIVQHPAARRRDPSTPVRTVALKPGGAAKFLLTSSDVIPSPGCQHAWLGTTLQVIPPNTRTALLQPYKREFCNLRVGPVQPS